MCAVWQIQLFAASRVTMATPYAVSMRKRVTLYCKYQTGPCTWVSVGIELAKLGATVLLPADVEIT